MFTANAPDAWIRGHVVELRAAQKSTSGGSSDTDVNEFAAIPTGSPSSTAVITVTPVAKCPSTARNWASSGRRMSSVSAGPAGVVPSVIRGSYGRRLLHVERRLQCDRESLRRRDDRGPAAAGREVAGVAEDEVDLFVGVRGIVVEQRELAGAGLVRDVHGVL